jgi:hypothetical protein
MVRIIPKTSNEFIYPDKNEDKLHIKHARTIKFFLLYFPAAMAQNNPAIA